MPVYSFHNYNFKVEIKDLGTMRFSELSGGDVSFEPIEYREGNFSNSSPIKLQGFAKYGNVTLKYGLTSDKQLYDWLNTSPTSLIDRKDITISLLADDHKTVLATWTLTNAMPIRVALSDFNATGNEVAIETIEIACEMITRGA